MSTRITLSALLIVGASAAFGATATAPASSPALRELFAKPTRDYTSGPLWVWADLMTDDMVLSSLRDLHAQGVRQPFVHPRPGLMTPYLSEEWFRLWKVVLDEAKKLDMNVWIYDENSYPSGFAGGFVPDAMPESRGRGLSITEADQPPKPGDDLIAVYRRYVENVENITAAVKSGGTIAPGKFVVATLLHAQPAPWHGGKTYVDLLYPGVTEKFLEITLEPYKKRFGADFGKYIPGSFTDEPELRPAGGLPWTADLPEQFKKRWNYDLIANLPSLNLPIGDWKKVRHNYYSTLNDLFVERWAKPYSKWCEANGIEFTGHYWEHEWPVTTRVPDNMAMYALHQRPAIDTLMNTYSEGRHAQFGNARAVRELASVANQMGRTRTLCEAYGAAGWELRFEDMKRIGDWIYSLGVNTMNEHIADVSIRGARKRDHPQSFSYHEPWWEAYHVMADYWARLSVATSAGRQINDILLLEPTTSAWLYNRESPDDPALEKIREPFEKLIQTWERTGYEYDLGSEDIIARYGSVVGDTLHVGQRGYQLIILPPATENLNSMTVALIEQYLQGGGTLLCCGEVPSRVDGAESKKLSELAAGNPGWKNVPLEAAAALVRARIAVQGFRIDRAAADKGLPLHMRRTLGDGELLFVANTSIDQPTKLTVNSRLKGVEQWDLRTGKTRAYPFKAGPRGFSATVDLPPCGSILLFLSKAEGKPGEPEATAASAKSVAAAGEMTIKRLDPNVLTLDYVDVTAAGETRKSISTLHAGHWIFEKHGLGRNPWDRAVQFKDTLITKAFPADSGFEATYRFTVLEAVPPSLHAVIERADLYTITCNGQPVAKLAKDSWWLDKQFGRMDITRLVKVGENTLTIAAKPMTMLHELESAYLLGEFAVQPAEKGFVIAPAKPLKLGPWNAQGCKLFSHRVAYTQTFKAEAAGGRWLVSLPAWQGSVAKVVVNGQDAGWIAAQPYECEVGDKIKAGDNRVQVIVYGTLRNTLGPHHNQSIGLVGPGHFDSIPAEGPPPGEKYVSLPYGLFEKPFELRRAEAK